MSPLTRLLPCPLAPIPTRANPLPQLLRLWVGLMLPRAPSTLTAAMCSSSTVFIRHGPLHLPAVPEPLLLACDLHLSPTSSLPPSTLAAARPICLVGNWCSRPEAMRDRDFWPAMFYAEGAVRQCIYLLDVGGGVAQPPV
jgi:hypothetical protein